MTEAAAVDIAVFQMWVTIGLAGVTLILYVTEWLSMELTSLLLLFALLVLFHFFPVETESGRIVLEATELVRGFANPALITVLALLVVGEGLVRTGALNGVAGILTRPGIAPIASLFLIMLLVLVLSAFMNNTPVVVIFIPILRLLATESRFQVGRVMMPLSYIAILGGAVTLVGSSTNLLVSSSLIELGRDGLDFFDVTPMGLILAGVGSIYTLFILPFLLPARESPAQDMTGQGRQYISQLKVAEDSDLVGEKTVAGFFKSLPDVTIRMIVRGERPILPPFEEVTVRPGDVLVVAATRKALTEAVSKYPKLFQPLAVSGAHVDEEEVEGDEPLPGTPDRLIVEAMVVPASRMAGLSLGQIAFPQRFGGLILGIQRRARMIRDRMSRIRLQAGDTLLILGTPDVLQQVRAEHDLVVLSGTAAELPRPHHTKRALLIFLVAIALAASGVVPILVAALGAATLMIASGTLNLRQAGRAIDRKIVLLVAVALALADALQSTGGAELLAREVLSLFEGATPPVVLSVFFLMVSLFTTLLTNNACAVLFTPIGLNMAEKMLIDPMIFALTVLFAANCSFASPVAYQTNLLVMGPGRYRFHDYMKGGLPLVFILWLTFSFSAPLLWNI